MRRQETLRHPVDPFEQLSERNAILPIGLARDLERAQGCGRESIGRMRGRHANINAVFVVTLQ